MPDLVIELGRGEVLKPSDSPRQGDRREVKLVPTAFESYHPCLWRSPIAAVEDSGSGPARGHWCVLLVDRGALVSGKPQTMAVFVPDVLWDKLPLDVVEW